MLKEIVNVERELLKRNCNPMVSTETRLKSRAKTSTGGARETAILDMINTRNTDNLVGQTVAL